MGTGHTSTQDEVVLRSFMDILRRQKIFFSSGTEPNGTILEFEVVSLHLYPFIGLFGKGRRRELLVVTREIHD